MTYQGGAFFKMTAASKWIFLVGHFEFCFFFLSCVMQKTADKVTYLLGRKTSYLSPVLGKHQ